MSKKSLHIIGVIPARLASTRFLRKPLAPILGMPMIGHVFFRSKMSKLLDEVYVATCDQEIAQYTKSLGGQAIMTADTHERASDRTAEALLAIENMTGTRSHIVVMIQRDEPMGVPEIVEQGARALMEDETILFPNFM